LLGGDINDVEYDHTLQPDEERGPPRWLNILRFK
jgi:hypothetical protein